MSADSIWEQRHAVKNTREEFFGENAMFAAKQEIFNSFHAMGIPASSALVSAVDVLAIQRLQRERNYQYSREIEKQALGYPNFIESPIWKS